jgi:phosphate transport system substrate-binding protein
MSLRPRRCSPIARTLRGLAGLPRAALWLSLCGTGACKHEAGMAHAGELAGGGADGARVAAAQARGVIMIDGSSTVFPISEAVAEEFRAQSQARVTIGISGTGGGFKKFCSGETAITGASRPVKPVEISACQRGGVEYIELPIAYDGIAVVVHPSNDWAVSMTVSELAALWRPEAQRRVQRWSQLRSGWPDAEIHLFGPGVDSGTYDYFTLAVVGTEHASRGDFTSSEDDNVLVQGVSRDPLALGFFGYAYYASNRDRLRLVAIDDQRDDNGKGAVLPGDETVQNGSYSPLSRPVFLYVNKAAAARPEVDAFVRFYLEQARRLVREVGYIALPEAVYRLAARRFATRLVGTIFGGSGSRVGVTVESLLAAE